MSHLQNKFKRVPSSNLAGHASTATTSERTAAAGREGPTKVAVTGEALGVGFEVSPW